MRILTTLFLLSLCGLRAESFTATAHVIFDGTSTLHDFQGEAASVPAAATWTRDGTGGVLEIPAIAVTVRDLSTHHARRDANMMQMFEPDAHPVIVGHIRGWRLPPDGVSEQTLFLDIHGTSQEVPVRVLSLVEDAGGLRLVCEFSLSLKACTLQRPSVLGIIRVGDIVRLRVETTLEPVE